MSPIASVACCASVAAALASSMVGCATSGQVADQIVKSNMAQETAENELLLLNILRAYRRKPMHFTQVSAIHLPVGFGNPTFSLATPFGGDSSKYGLTTGLAISQSVDTAVQNTQEFMRGITTPVPPATMAYYLDQGWPKAMVFMLFVRQIKVSVDGKTTTYTSYPESEKDSNAFLAQVSKLTLCDFELKSDDDKSYGPRLSEADVRPVAALAAAKAASLALTASAPASGPITYQFVTPAKGAHLVVTDMGDGKCELAGESVRMDHEPHDAAAIAASKTKRNWTFVLRSPEAMLYYLGEIARAQLDGQRHIDDSLRPADVGFPRMPYGPIETTTKHVPEATLFEVHKGSDPGALVSVAFEGETYSVPMTSSTNQSTHVLSLMYQIISMQNKATDLPGTAVVRVVP